VNREFAGLPCHIAVHRRILQEKPTKQELDYARTTAAPAGPAFHIGNVALLLSVADLLASVGLFLLEWRFQLHSGVDAILVGMGAVSVLSLGMGIGGCFQSGARVRSLAAIVISLLLLVGLPALGVL
jgi:hypothetical protein